ncbi:hypothetical protein TNCT_327131 [Trichonephila clavata]|uniref:DUF5641 domain-containing protein n=1 Tax=Trichonephila clavata TaxID=2740835 RepID=A0A8X6KJ94_TRICU|nr:hypothetical protein TNCT_327131 [Trichonephila clavata]
MSFRGQCEVLEVSQLREQTQRHRKSRSLTVGDVVVLENNLKNRTLWSFARIIELIPGKDGHVRVARVRTETGELVRPAQRLYNLELLEPEINLPKEQTDSVIRAKRDIKHQHLQYPYYYSYCCILYVVFEFLQLPKLKGGRLLRTETEERAEGELRAQVTFDPGERLGFLFTPVATGGGDTLRRRKRGEFLYMRLDGGVGFLSVRNNI